MVDIYVLDTNFQVVGIVDTYESFIWTDRFRSYGDFEIYTSFDINLVNLCKQDYYLWIKDSDHMMIIEGLEIESDAENGNKLKITGRSLESIIDRRIVWQQMTIAANTTLQDAIKRLLDDAFLNPHPYSGNYSATSETRRRNATQLETANKRKLTNLVFQPTDDSYILNLKVEKQQLTGDNVYDILQSLLDEVNGTVGYKIILNEENKFVFELYTGVDRSYDQKEYVKTEDLTINTDKNYYILHGSQYIAYTQQYYEYVSRVYVLSEDLVRVKKKTYYVKTGDNTYTKYTGDFPIVYEYRGLRPYVVFSPQFDNVINSNYIDNISEMKNVTLVAGEGEGTSRKSVIVGDKEGLERRELFTDARDMQTSEYGTGTKYTEALKTRGLNKLVENARVTSYEGQVEATRQYVYGKDFFMGDVIQMANEYGIEGNARVIEWVMSDSTTGFEIYPTFDAVQVIDSTTTEEDNTDV